MKNGSGQYGACCAIRESVIQVVEIARPARGDHRYLNGFRYSPRQVDVIATLSSVGIHTGEQDLACAEIGDSRGPLNGISLGTLPAAVSVDPEIGVRP